MLRYGGYDVREERLKITFIMPVFNSGEYMVQAVDSIRANSCAHVDIEILLIDDCSTDPQTARLLSELATASDVRILHQARNGGPARARNAGILAATGEWIAFLDSDDLLASGSLLLRYNAIILHPKIRWMAGDMLEMRKLNELTHSKSFKVDSSNATMIGPGLFELKRPAKELITWATLPVLGSMMVHRDLIKEIGLFDDRMIYGEDIYFSLIASTQADLYWIERPCLYLRRHHESMMKDVLRLAHESPKYTRRLVAEPRLQVIRRQLRWQHAASLRQSSKVFLAHGFRFLALKLALISMLWTPNDVNSFRSLWRACFARRVADRKRL